MVSELGVGTTFQVMIRATAVTAEQPAPPAIDVFLTDKRTLIVDDNETNRQILTKQTESWGMMPVAVDSGAVALALIEKGESYDVAILDMMMRNWMG